MLHSVRFHNPTQFLLAFLGLAIFTVVAYYPITEATSIVDDKDYYIDDPLMTAPDGLKRIWLNPLENNQVWPYIPITRTTFWLERQLWGLDLSVSHWINVGFHLLSGLLFWGVLRSFKIRGAWLITLCFVLHPIHVQSVAWITERKNVVSAVFFFLTLWGYFHFEQKNSKKWYFFTLGFYLCALLSKTSTIMLPLLFIFCRLWWRHSWRKSDIVALIPFFLLALGIGYTRIWFELYSFGASNPSYARGFLERILTAGHIPFFYISKLIFPDPLIFTYPKWEVDVTQISLYFPLLSIIVVTAVLLWRYQSWGKPVFLCLGMYSVLLFPVMGFFNNSWTKFSFVTDHWIHLPSVPLFVLFVQGILKLFEKLETQKWLIFGRPIFWSALLFTLIILTRNQVSIYKNPQTLWAATMAENPNSWLAYGELGREYLEEGKYELALKHLNKALTLTQVAEELYSNRGLVYLHLRQFDRAIEDYNQALVINSSYAAAYNNRGNAYSALQQYHQAIEDYNKLLLLQPSHANGYYNRGNAYAGLRQFNLAIQDYSNALALDPNRAAFYKNRGIAYEILKKYEQALQDYTKALSLRSKDGNLYYLRGGVYAALKQNDQAIREYQKALALRPKDADIYIKRGESFRALNRNDLACSDWQIACQLGHCSRYMEASSKKDCP